MGECTVLAHVKTSTGEVVESKLFGDLLSHLPTRELAKEYYSVGTNQEFLDSVRDRAEFDKNGEITFNSLRKLANINIKEAALLESVNKKFHSGTYDYSQAVAKLQSFNRNSQFKDDFMATIKAVDGGKYELSIVKRTKTQEAALQEEIRKRSLQERLMYHLEKAGVSVEFMKRDDKMNGRYSTKNAQQTADGLYRLIQLVNGEHVTDTLAEEAGHFVIGALGESPLVQRLLETLTPDVQKEILGNEYDERILGKNASREVAGILVGRALQSGVVDEKPWQRLVHRVVNLAKRIFSHFSKKNNVAYRAALEAQEMADKMARDFMSNNFSGSIENALNTEETLYNAQTSANTALFRKTLNKLLLMAEEMKAIGQKTFAKQLTYVANMAATERIKYINEGHINADNMALEGLAIAFSNILDKLGPGKEMDNLLKGVNFDNDLDFYSHMSENANKLRQVRIFLKHALLLQHELSEAVISVDPGIALKGNFTHVGMLNSTGHLNILNLAQVSSQLGDILGRTLADLNTREKQFFLRFCEDTLGKKSITRAARVIWHSKGRWGLKFLEEEQYTILQGLEHLEKDITMFERFLASMSNNSDLIGQIADKTTKAANKWADDATNMCQDQLRVLEARFKKITGTTNTRMLFERSERTGQLTGNIISEHNWGDWESDFEEFKESEKKAFLEAKKGDLENKSDIEKAVMWDTWFRAKAKEWHKTHSRWDDVAQTRVPNNSYYNPEFEKLMSKYPELRSWYDDFMELKRSLDGRIPEGSTMSVRMPQFKGRFIARVKNQIGTGTIKAIGHALRSNILDTFCESSEDTDYGSDQTYSSVEEQLFADRLAQEREDINRVPLFGIRKLQDMTELSTDLFQSTLAYASMANSYAAMNKVVDTLEVGREVLLNRSVKNDIKERDRTGNKSRAYNRYLKFLDKQVYGISNSRHKISLNVFKLTRKVVLEKILGAISNFGSKYFLGGNVAGGIVNTLTGFNELFKEALSGEYFTLNDFRKANAIYFKSFVENWMDYGKDVKNNKISLLIRHFNMLGDNRREYRDWENDRNVWTRLYNCFSQSLFLPYKSGDHYMSSISYIALLRKTMVYDEHGNKISLINAYKEVENTDRSGKIKAGKTLALGGTYFKSKEGRLEHALISSIISKIEAAVSNPMGAPITLTTEEEAYINDHNYNLASMENTLFKLRQAAVDLTWSATDEVELANKAREINIRMHGIYNNQDKVAFSQNWYGNALLSMRGYALGMLERRIGQNKYNTILGQDTEGTLNTLSKLFLSSFTDRGGLKLTLRGLLLPFGKGATQALQTAGFSANQVRNLKRNWGDLFLIGLLTLLRGATALGKDDDDDDQNEIAKGLLYYFSSRLQAEQTAFNLPHGWSMEMNTLLELEPSGIAAVIDLVKTSYLLATQWWQDPEDSEYYYQQDKEGIYEEGDSKAITHFKRMFPYLRSLYVLRNPYEAAKSWEYGRTIKTR